MGKSPIDRQPQHALLLGTELIQCSGSALGLLTQFNLWGISIDRFGCFFNKGRHLRAALDAASAVNQPSPRDHRHKCSFRCDRRVEARGMPPQLNKNLLNSIFGLARHHATGQRPDEPAIAIDAIADRYFIALGDSLQQVGWGIGQGAILSGDA